VAKKKAKPPQGEEKIRFEAAFERLTEIAAELEGGEISLDESIGRYEEGMKLIARCQQILDEAEQKIELLAKKSDGTLEAEPFEGAEATDLPDAPQSVKGRKDTKTDDGELFGH
jgi:exodeoxyribonuclease VII small subunit